MSLRETSTLALSREAHLPTMQNTVASDGKQHVQRAVECINACGLENTMSDTETIPCGEQVYTDQGEEDTQSVAL